MAVNLISSNDIGITQSGSDISLDFTPNAVANKNVYPISETRIGTWTTGKPLYRIVYKAENKASSYSITPPANVDIYTTLRVMQLDGDGAFIPDYYWNSTDYLRIFKNNNGIQIRTSKADNSFTHWIVLEYTKTTD